MYNLCGQDDCGDQHQAGFRFSRNMKEEWKRSEKRNVLNNILVWIQWLLFSLISNFTGNHVSSFFCAVVMLTPVVTCLWYGSKLRRSGVIGWARQRSNPHGLPTKRQGHGFRWVRKSWTGDRQTGQRDRREVLWWKFKGSGSGLWCAWGRDGLVKQHAGCVTVWDNHFLSASFTEDW